MIDFLTLKSETFALDISDLSLKIVKLKKKGKFFDVACFKDIKIKPGIIRKGEIKKQDALSEIIKKAIFEVEGEKIKTKYVIASLPEEKAYLEVIKMPKMSAEDLKSAIVYEAENYIPLPIEKVYLDFQVVPSINNHPDYLEVLIVSLPKKTVDPYISCFKKAGLKPKILETESLAISRALVKNQVSTTPVLLIDLGATRTGLIIFSGKSLRFASSSPISCQLFTETISRTFQISMTKAEKLKIKYGLFDAMVPGLTDLLEQIKKYLEFYQSHACSNHSRNGKAIEKIILCGGGAKLKGIKEFFSSELKIPVQIGNSYVNILPKTQKKLSLSVEKSIVYTTALGLALRGIKK